jgi:hypothetical protein
MHTSTEERCIRQADAANIMNEKRHQVTIDSQLV